MVTKKLCGTYSLQCDQYPEQLVSKLIEESNNLNDVTLVTDDLVQQEFPANKAVLSASSEVLKQVLLNSSDPHPRIYLEGVQKEDLKLILDFMYSGVANVEQKAIDRFLDLGKHLQFKEISAKSLNITPLEKVDQILKSKEEKKRKLILEGSIQGSSQSKKEKKNMKFHTFGPENFPKKSKSKAIKRGKVGKSEGNHSVSDSNVEKIVPSPGSLHDTSTPTENLFPESANNDDTLNIEKNQLMNETDILEKQVGKGSDDELIKEEVVSTEEQIEDLYDEFTVKPTDENIVEKDVDICGYENVLVATDTNVSNTSQVETTVNDESNKKDLNKCPLCNRQFSKKTFLEKHVFSKHGKVPIKPVISNITEKKAYLEVDVVGNSGKLPDLKTTEKVAPEPQVTPVADINSTRRNIEAVTVEENCNKEVKKLDKPKPKPKVIEVGPNGIKYQNLDPSIFGSHSRTAPKVADQEKPKSETKEQSKHKNESVKCPECGFQVSHKILLKNHIESRHYKLYRDIFIFKTATL